ncbi:MAG: MFS transporter [Gammaproteobacteria bacterium]|nr:MFS transporter [Gammaproteobacteria bacterium]
MAAYALPAVATQFVYAPLSTVLPGIYAKYYGLSAAAISGVLLATRFFDAVTDPLIGHLSDTTRGRFGRRKPWIAAGCLVTALAMWQVADPRGSAHVALYFTLWSAVFYFGWTMMEIPHTAWGSELTNDYKRRNQVFFSRTLASVVGPLGFAAVPLVIGAATTEITPQVMRATAVAFAVAAPLCVAAALVFVADRQDGTATRQKMKVGAALRAIGYNGIFWRLFGVFVMGGLAAGIYGALQFVYLDTYLGIGDMVPYALGAMMICSLLGLPLWLWLLNHVDKHRAWALSLGLAGVWVGLPATLTPGESSFVPMLVMVIGLALASGAGAIVPFALLGDLVDYDELKTGVNRAGAYYAVFLFGVKVNAAIGGSIAFGILAIAGYDAAADVHSTAGILGLKTAFAVVPGILFAAAALSVVRFPLTRRRHEIVRRALARRAARG